MRLSYLAVLSTFILPSTLFACPPEVDINSPQAQGIYFLKKINEPSYFKKISSYFQDSVKKKEPHAQFVLDSFNNQIQMIPPQQWKDKNALEFLTTLSENGIGFASLLIGAGYYNQDKFEATVEGDKKQFAKREKYFRRAAEQGHLPALVP